MLSLTGRATSASSGATTPQYLVSFCLLMSDGTVYDIAHDGVVDYDYDEDGTSDLYGYTQTGPIKNVLKFVSDIKTINFPDIEFLREADKVHHEPGIMRIFAQSEEEELEFLRFFGWNVWDAPYDSRERLMKHLAVTAATHNASVHGIVATGSFIETE